MKKHSFLCALFVFSSILLTGCKNEAEKFLDLVEDATEEVENASSEEELDKIFRKYEKADEEFDKDKIEEICEDDEELREKIEEAIEAYGEACWELQRKF